MKERLLDRVLPNRRMLLLYLLGVPLAAALFLKVFVGFPLLLGIAGVGVFVWAPVLGPHVTITENDVAKVLCVVLFPLVFLMYGRGEQIKEVMVDGFRELCIPKYCSPERFSSAKEAFKNVVLPTMVTEKHRRNFGRLNQNYPPFSRKAPSHHHEKNPTSKQRASGVRGRH